MKSDKIHQTIYCYHTDMNYVSYIVQEQTHLRDGRQESVLNCHEEEK